MARHGDQHLPARRPDAAPRPGRVGPGAVALWAAVAALSGCGGGGDDGKTPDPWSGVTIGEPTAAATFSTDASALTLGGVSFLPATYTCSLIGGSLPAGYEVRWRNDATGASGGGEARITCFPFVLVGWNTYFVPLAMGANPVTVTVRSAIDGREGRDTITVTRVADTTPPRVSWVTPPDDAVAVPLSTPVVVGFDEAIDTADLAPGQITLTEASTGTPVPLSLVPSPNRMVALLQPTVPLAAETRHEVHVGGIADAAGNAMTTAFRSGFTTTGVTVDDQPPTVVAIDPPAGAVGVPEGTVVELRFSEPVAFGGPDFYVRVFVAASGEPVTGHVSAQEPVVQATFYPDRLAAGTTYRVEAFASDLAGNPMRAPFSASFTTAP